MTEAVRAHPYSDALSGRFPAVSRTAGERSRRHSRHRAVESGAVGPRISFVRSAEVEPQSGLRAHWALTALQCPKSTDSTDIFRHLGRTQMVASGEGSRSIKPRTGQSVGSKLPTSDGEVAGSSPASSISGSPGFMGFRLFQPSYGSECALGTSAHRGTSAFTRKRAWGPRSRAAALHGKRCVAGWARRVERTGSLATWWGLHEGGRNRAVRRRCAGAVASRSASTRRRRDAHRGAGRRGGALGRPRQARIVGRRVAAADGSGRRGVRDGRCRWGRRRRGVGRR